SIALRLVSTGPAFYSQQWLAPVQGASMRFVSLAALFGLCFFMPDTARSAGDTIRIGILNDQSALYADFGGKTSVDAARMAVEDFGGKVLGRSIEIVSGDHQNGVGAVADLTNSAGSLAVQPIAQDQGKVNLAVGPATA